MTMGSRRMTFLGHLAELRRRVLIALGVWLVGCAVCWPFAKEGLIWLLGPLGRPAIFLGPAEGFLVTFKVAMGGGLVLALPVILWQVLAFSLPALKRRERRAVGLLLMSGTLAFVSGAWFGWRVVLPVMMKFFMSFNSELLQAQVAANRYLSFVLFLLLGAGAAFEFPIVIAGLAWARLVTARTLLRQWRPAVLGCFVAGAILTPSPDAVTMLLVAVMLVVLYLAGVASAALMER